MKFLLDIGNTRLKWGYEDAGGVVQTGFAYHDEAWVERWATMPKPTEVAAVSVAPTRNGRVAAACLACWGLAPRFYTACLSGFGIKSHYSPPHTLGADRFAALVGARIVNGGPQCVVSCGTAVTVDLLDEEGVFWGGVIMPGLVMGRKALIAGAELVLGGALYQPVAAVGTDTSAAVEGGLVLGLAGAMDRLIEEQQAMLGKSCTVVLTGGDADTLNGYVCHKTQVIPDLVLRGLAVMAR